jgi:hypothetical protein
MEILLRDWNTYSDFDDPYKSFRNEYFSTPMGLSETPLHNTPASITGSMSHISPIRGWNLSSDSASFAHILVSALIYDCVYYRGFGADILSSINLVCTIYREAFALRNFEPPTTLQICSNTSWVKAQFALVLADVSLQLCIDSISLVEKDSNSQHTFIICELIHLSKLFNFESGKLKTLFQQLTDRFPCTIINADLTNKTFGHKMSRNTLQHRTLHLKYLSQLRQELKSKVFPVR